MDYNPHHPLITMSRKATTYPCPACGRKVQTYSRKCLRLVTHNRPGHRQQCYGSNELPVNTALLTGKEL